MADKAAKFKRSSCAEKLENSLRQLRRYLEKPDEASERALQTKIDMVAVDREALVTSHHTFCEKTNSDLTLDENRNFINPKVDAPFDCIEQLNY